MFGAYLHLPACISYSIICLLPHLSGENTLNPHYPILNKYPFQIIVSVCNLSWWPTSWCNLSVMRLTSGKIMSARMLVMFVTFACVMCQMQPEWDMGQLYGVL